MVVSILTFSTISNAAKSFPLFLCKQREAIDM